MKRTLKKLIALTLTLVMVFGAAPLNGFVGSDLFGTSASAASVSDLSFTLINDGTEYEVSDCDENASGELVIPSIYNGLPVTSVGDYAFYYCLSLTSVTIPDSVTSIGASAFADCRNITSINIPDGVTSIGANAFAACWYLTNITIPDSITSIGDRAFSGCGSLTSITVSSNNANYSSDSYGVLFNKDKTELIQYPGGTEAAYVIPDSVIIIGVGAFSGCNRLTSITIPDSVTSIRDDAFSNCWRLTNFTIPNSVTSVGRSAFSGCGSLTSITIPDSVTSIGEGAFNGCESLTSINIPDTVTSIEANTFSGCYSLTSVTIPDSVTSIGESAFERCASLTEINWNAKKVDYFPRDGKVFDGAGNNSGGITVNFGGNVDEIPSYMFYSSYSSPNITNVNISDGVTSIGEHAFGALRKLETVTIPASVTNIGEDAFFAYSFEMRDMVIRCYKNTVAHQYALDQNIAFLLLDGIRVSGILLNRDTAKLPVGNTVQLSASFAPQNADCKLCTWSTSNDGVATVDEAGLVSAVSAGTATITVKSVDGGFTAKCAVTVTQPVSGVRLNKSSTSIIKGKTEQLSVTVNPSNASNKNVTWSSSNSDVATVSSTGKVTAKAAGSATITVKTADGGKTATCNVTVKNEVINVTGVSLNKTTLTMANGTSETLKATVKPSNATNKKVTWSSSNNSVVTVNSNGMLSAVSAGSATITVKTSDGSYSAKCTVTVVSNSVGSSRINYTIEDDDVDVPGYTYLSFNANNFAGDSNNYNHQLAQFCSQFAMLGYAKKDQLTSALQSMGFDVNSNYINMSMPKDKVNYFIASKKIMLNNTVYTLVFVGTIGSHGEQWYSNFDPGYGSYHNGFYNAYVDVNNRLNSYLSSIGANKNTTKILLTGHSRGAAVSNILAYNLISNENKAKKENIFTYAFATPNYTNKSNRNSSEYKRVFNFVNPEDFVTKVMPAKWGYGRYGTTLTLPSKTNESAKSYKIYFNNMQKMFSQFTSGGTYYPYPDGEASVYEVINKLSSTVTSIEDYYNKEMQVNFFDYWTPYKVFQRSLCPLVAEKSNSKAFEDGYRCVANLWINPVVCKTYKKVMEFFMKSQGYYVINEMGKKADFKMQLLYASMVAGLATIGVVESNDFVNAKPYFGDAHCAQTYAAYLMSMSYDQAYTWAKGNYRKGYKSTVNCPVDVEITDLDSGEVVGRIVNNIIDEEIAAKENSIVMSVEGDSKSYWLPSNGNYDVKLIGNDNGEMDITVSEIDSDLGEISRVNFSEVEVQDGFEYSVEMPCIGEDAAMESEQGDGATIEDTVLILETGEALEPTEYLEGEELSTLSVAVTIEGIGSASGYDAVTKGDYILMEASTDSNNSFLGWYDSNGTLLCADESYGFVINESVSLVAKFTNVVVEPESVSMNKDSTVIVVGNSEMLTATVMPENTTYPNAVWTSSDESVATVDSFGVVSAVSPGTATITAATYDGTYSCTCDVLVVESSYTVTWSIDGTETVDSYEYGQTIVKPDDPTKHGYTFKGWNAEVPDTMPAEDLTFTAEFENIVLTKIEINTTPTKTQYRYKESGIDLGGLTLKATYSDGSTSIISDTEEVNVTGFDTSSTGSKTITVEYGGYNTSFNIEVKMLWWQWIIRIVLFGWLWY